MKTRTSIKSGAVTVHCYPQSNGTKIDGDASIDLIDPQPPLTPR